MNNKKKPQLLLLAAAWTGLLALSPPLHAAAGDTIADAVLGQRRFSTDLPYFADGTVLDAADIAIDRSAVPNRVYIASPDFNRVLGWSDIGRFRAGAPADLVLGQPSVFNGSYAGGYLSCPAPASATTFCRPARVAVDPAGNLYVLDSLNYRVLEFDRPFATDRVADRVFGQASFTSRRLPAQPLNDPADLAVDAHGDLWVIDPAGSRRIFEYDAPLSHDTRPDRVIAAATEAACESGPPQPLPCRPLGLEVSPQGDLYVLDAGFPGSPSRELVYRQPLTTDLLPDFTLAGTGSTGPPVGVFNPAGDLIFLAGGLVWRYPAPIGPETAPEPLSPRLVPAFGGRPALDTQGNLYVASYQDAVEDSFVYVVDAPFQAETARIGRELKTSRSLALPAPLAVDRSSSPNHLYVVDAYNRVLGWRNAEGFASGAAADLVLGGSVQSKPDLPGSCSGASAGLFCPYGSFNRGGLAVDSRGNLWVADVDNHRVLEFDRPFESDGVADRVLGQGGSFTSRTCNLGGLSARSLCFPGALAFDRQDHLYVADLANQRVLLFESPLTSDAAGRVFGQAGFTQGACNRGHSKPTAATLCLGDVEGESNPRFYGASSLAVDPRGNLYVADTLNNRVLIYRDPLTSDAVADAVADEVIGQDGFRQTLHGTGPRRFSFSDLAVAVAPAGELYVADPGNDRVLEFQNPLADTTASRVFGHADFTTGGVPYPGPFSSLPTPTASNLVEPMGVAVDAAGNLYVADTGHNRVLRFDRP
ncbi:MAG TPA: NHL repeat-containing protein [Thermoanaerobaculia bacterium]